MASLVAPGVSFFTLGASVSEDGRSVSSVGGSEWLAVSRGGHRARALGYDSFNVYMYTSLAA